MYSQLLCLTSIFHEKYVKTILNATMPVACRRRHFSKKCETELSKQVEPPSWDSEAGGGLERDSLISPKTFASRFRFR